MWANPNQRSKTDIAGLRCGNVSCLCTWDLRTPQISSQYNLAPQDPDVAGLTEQQPKTQTGEPPQELPLDHLWPRQAKRLVFCLSDISVAMLERRRLFVLDAIMVLTGSGIVLSALAMIGGLGEGELLANLSWITFWSPVARRYGGIRYMCSEKQNSAWHCSRLDDLECNITIMNCTNWLDIACQHRQAMSKVVQAQCTTCRNESQALLFPTIVGSVMYLKILHGTYERHRGRDTAINKLGTVGGSVFGGLATLWIIMVYCNTCVLSAQRNEPGLVAVMGPGFACMALATLMKILVGLLHLGLKANGGTNSEARGAIPS